ncbi:hypothetical protein SAMN04489798_5663 [Pseudomonas arsenicoxydans]|uniref:Uncharacterized protein n=1 Tax=Pseudomonas arsenicoxydans TaxID=702115 RepID=A0A1H0SHX4_9PSED|nr:hypothetical protein [Pseudomonas arsenicoxydans]SDP40828.1 hypothetical protein SAMN04489798_5663 [Pseudomonas arsenicoxydans]
MTKNKPNQGARKTETLTLRLDPKIKFLIEMVARKKRQSITGVIESAIEEYAKGIKIDAYLWDDEEKKNVEQEVTLLRLCNEIYSTDDSHRFGLLFYVAPQLMNHEEQRLKETVYASPVFWLDYPHSDDDKLEDDIDINKLRAHWEELLVHMAEHKDSSVVVPFTPK